MSLPLSIGDLLWGIISLYTSPTPTPTPIPSLPFFLRVSPNSFSIPLPIIRISLSSHTPILIRINLLIQHNTIHARLEQRKHKRRFALEATQAVEDSGAGFIRESEQQRGHLFGKSACQNFAFFFSYVHGLSCLSCLERVYMHVIYVCVCGYMDKS